MIQAKKRIATVFAIAGVSLAMLAGIGPAAASARSCVSKAEFHRVHRGMSQHHVARIFDTNGKQILRIGAYSSRDYKVCTSRYGFVTVDYKRHRVKRKAAFWG